MSQAEAYLDYLRSEGFRPILDDAGDIVFKCEGRFYCVSVDDDDPLYFRLLFPNFWSLDSDAERRWALTVAAEVTAEYKVVKVYPQHDDVTASAEVFLARADDFRAVFERCLLAVQGAVRRFCERMDRRPRLRLVEET